MAPGNRTIEDKLQLTNAEGFYSKFCPEAHGLPSEEQQKKDNKELRSALDKEYLCK